MSDELPKRKEIGSILKNHNDSLIKKHFGDPPANDKEYRTALREALDKEYPGPKLWYRAGPQDHDPQVVMDDLLTHLDYAHGREEERCWWWSRREWLKRCHRSRATKVGAELKRYTEGRDGEGVILFVIGAMAAFHDLSDQEARSMARAALGRVRHERLMKSAKGARPWRRVRIREVR